MRVFQESHVVNSHIVVLAGDGYPRYSGWSIAELLVS